MVEQMIRRVTLGLGLVLAVTACGSAEARVAATGEPSTTTTHPPSTTSTEATTTTVAAREVQVTTSSTPPTTWASPTTTTTSPPPPPSPPPSTSGRFTLAQGDDFDRLAACESMGDTNRADGLTIDPAALSQRTTPVGRYRGAFQYDDGTAEEAGFQGDPVTYSYAAQKALTVRFQAKVGWGRWPHCRRVLGLR